VRVNVYAEEMSDRIEIIAKEIDGHTFTGLRFYLELPTSVPSDFKVQGSPYLESTKDPRIMKVRAGADVPCVNLQGPFLHRPGDDDSSAVTFWGKRDLREMLRQALDALNKHYEDTTVSFETATSPLPRAWDRLDRAERALGTTVPYKDQVPAVVELREAARAMVNAGAVHPCMGHCGRLGPDPWMCGACVEGARILNRAAMAHALKGQVKQETPQKAPYTSPRIQESVASCTSARLREIVEETGSGDWRRFALMELRRRYLAGGGALDSFQLQFLTEEQRAYVTAPANRGWCHPDHYLGGEAGVLCANHTSKPEKSERNAPTPADIAQAAFAALPCAADEPLGNDAWNLARAPSGAADEPLDDATDAESAVAKAVDRDILG
jgi:hypothetical protein